LTSDHGRAAAECAHKSHVDYLHAKILTLNALAATPTTISGSGSFSEASATSNEMTADSGHHAIHHPLGAAGPTFVILRIGH
jgi:hypothetical protein